MTSYGLGRTDLPCGNGTTMKQGIQGIVKLEAERILPGHGDVILGAEQLRTDLQRVERWIAFI